MGQSKPKKSKKQIILEEAATLFREKGYAATTMRDLAAKVGVEAASLYNHIKCKEEILSQICSSLADTYTSKMVLINATDATPIDKIKELLLLHVEINAMSSPLASVMNDEWRHLTEPERSDFLLKRRSYENQFLNIIEQGIADGSVQATDAKIALYTMLSSIRWLQHWYHANRDMDVEAVKSTIIGLLMNGIQKS
ncbi:TetR/AcrR family transcriptional regulator [Reichenbachiella carrageenanivorans]|uniref:TetR/AcrR family transcriptional regulator n=1 Tax=Reichenbachiella carrageenanivorans TaxID=2979869 RepID=A0ABY6CY61_9BACT|nr:TetR/AcrR family transcriptional regulator [Reichenbachiella carrageenanivorans]UXX78854.1 TetR/AcrR family transcriptional regulator [Reichenbachiella carrageenanivorans]